MRDSVPTRLIAVALAAGSTMVVPLSAPGSAAPKVSCSKLVSGAPVTVNKVLTVKATVSGCLPLSATGGSGKSVSTIGKTTISKTTWAGGKGTSIQTVKYAALKTLGKCAPGTTRLLITSTATGGSGAALKAIPKGSVGKSSVCLTKKSTSTLEPGTKSTF